MPAPCEPCKDNCKDSADCKDNCNTDKCSSTGDCSTTSGGCC